MESSKLPPPTVGRPARVKTSDDLESLAVDAVVKRVGESGQKGTTMTGRDFRERVGKL